VETVFDEIPAFKPGKYLTFRVARKDFAMPTDRVRGILPMHEMSPLHVTHAWLCGFTCIAGRDLPVVDLRAKLGIARGSHGREPFIVVVETEDHLLGFVADRISELIDARARDFRNGMLRTPGRPRKVLDPDRIMRKEDWEGLRIIL
jgi:chemotaxis signal transduction protein